MWVNKPLKFILFVVFTFGVTHSAPNATTQSNLQPGRNDITTVSTASSPEKTTIWTEQATPTNPTSANSVSNSSGQSNAYNPITTTSAPSTTIRCATVSDNSKTKLVIAGFYSDSSGQWDGSSMIPAVNLALKHVNENPNILKNYELDVKWKNSRCEAADGVWTFHSHLVEEPKKIMLLGPPCSPDTEPVAQTSERGNLVTVSYSAASPALSDKKIHPYFFRTYKTDVILNGARNWLFQKFSWTRIGSIHQNKDIFTLTHDHLYDLLKQEKNNVTVKEIFDETPKDHQIEAMKNEDIKIILASTYDGPARELFCKAFKQGLYGPDYVWILLGWYNYDWYRQSSSNCSKEEVETIVEESYYISMEAANFSETPDVLTVAGYTANEIKRQLLNECWDENVNATGLEMFGYDALWAIALGLHRTDEALAEKQYELGYLEDFNYNTSDFFARRLGYLLFQNMNGISFEGASGYVDLPFGDRHGVVNIEQLQPYCNEGWHHFNFSCYTFVNKTRNWTDSRRYCQNLAPERYSHLVSVLSGEESTFLENKTKGSWYIGLTYNKSLGQLFWVDTKKSEVKWIPKSFDSMEENSKCYVWKVNTGTWKPSDCSKPRHFICKRRADFREQVIYTMYSNKTGVSDVRKKGDFMWHGGKKPKDRTQPQEKGLTRGVYSVLAACACLGIILAISFLTFNILAREHRNLKLSSPKMNNLIVIGCILIYVSICILGMEVVDPNEIRVPVPAFCMLRLWLISIGFVLGFGAIFCKIWRVYKVASFKSGPRRVAITDSKLFGIVGILLLPDVLLLCLWTIIDPLAPEEHLIDTYNFVLQCSCAYFNVWAILLCAYKGLILVIGVFLAWETRNVKIAALNDSRSIGLCIYTTTLLCVIGIATAFPFPDVPGYQYIVTSSCMLFGTTFVLLVVFVPKIRNVRKPPKLDGKSSTTSVHGSVSARVQSMSEATIDLGCPSNNGNEVTGHLSSLGKLFSCPWKQSYDLDQGRDTNSRTRKDSTFSTDDVFE